MFSCGFMLVKILEAGWGLGALRFTPFLCGSATRATSSSHLLGVVLSSSPLNLNHNFLTLQYLSFEILGGGMGTRTPKWQICNLLPYPVWLSRLDFYRAPLRCGVNLLPGTSIGIFSLHKGHSSGS